MSRAEGVGESGSRGVGESGSRGVGGAGSQGVGEAGGQGVRESGSQRVREPGSQGVREDSLTGGVVAGAPVGNQLGEAARWNNLDRNAVKTTIPGLVLGRIIQYVAVAEVDDDLLSEVGQVLSIDRDQAATG